MIVKSMRLLPAVTAALMLGACSPGHLPGAPAASGNPSPEPAGASAPATPGNAQAAAATQANVAQPDRSTPDSSYVTVTSGNQLMFLYTALSGLPPDWDAMARNYSSDYYQANDAFRKHDLMEALKPKMQAAITEAKAHPYLIWNAGNPQLSPYDFTRKGFPVGSGQIDPSGYVYVSDNGSYHLSFTNGSDFQFLPVPDENVAKQIEQYRSSYTNMALRVFAFAQSADPSNDTVKAVITKVQLLGPHNEVLLEEKSR